MKTRRSLFSVLITLALLLLAGFYVILLGYTYWQYHPTALWELIATREIRHAIGLSVVCATIATGIALFIAIPASYVLSRKNFPGKIFLDTLLDIPVFVSPVAIGALLLVFFTSPLSKHFQDKFLSHCLCRSGNCYCPIYRHSRPRSPHDEINV